MDNSNVLDAWSDFVKIKNILNNSNESIVIALGASWCHKCDPVKKAIFQFSEKKLTNVYWLWLDLETHCEFLGDFFPETIPLVWVYQGPHLIRYRAIDEVNIKNRDFFEFIQSIPTSESHLPSDIRPHLLQQHHAA